LYLRSTPIRGLSRPSSPSEAKRRHTLYWRTPVTILDEIPVFIPTIATRALYKINIKDFMNIKIIRHGIKEWLIRAFGIPFYGQTRPNPAVGMGKLGPFLMNKRF
jgi:hypothetical protein